MSVVDTLDHLISITSVSKYFLPEEAKPYLGS